MGGVAELAEVGVWFVLAELGLRVLSLPTLTRWMGLRLVTQDSQVPATGRAIGGPPTVAEIRKTELVGKVGRHWILSEGACLRQALVAGHFLRRLGPALRIGVAKQGDDLAAHAWIDVGESSIGFQDSYLPLWGEAPAGEGSHT